MCACALQTQRLYAFSDIMIMGNLFWRFSFIDLIPEKKITNNNITTDDSNNSHTEKTIKSLSSQQRCEKLNALSTRASHCAAMHMVSFFFHCLWKWAEAKRHLFSKTYIQLIGKIFNVVRFFVVCCWLFSLRSFEYKILLLNALAFQLCISMADIKPQKPLKNSPPYTFDRKGRWCWNDELDLAQSLSLSQPLCLFSQNKITKALLEQKRHGRQKILSIFIYILFNKSGIFQGKCRIDTRQRKVRRRCLFFFLPSPIHSAASFQLTKIDTNAFGIEKP